MTRQRHARDLLTPCLFFLLLHLPCSSRDHVAPILLLFFASLMQPCGTNNKSIAYLSKMLPRETYHKKRLTQVLLSYKTNNTMLRLCLPALLCLWLITLDAVVGFAVRPGHGIMTTSCLQSSTTSSSMEDIKMYDMPTQCYIVNQELVETEGEQPEIVCTSSPKDYEWFNGLDVDALVPVDGTSTEALECAEGASPRGIPEWECKLKP